MCGIGENSREGIDLSWALELSGSRRLHENRDLVCLIISTLKTAWHMVDTIEEVHERLKEC